MVLNDIKVEFYKTLASLCETFIQLCVKLFFKALKTTRKEYKESFWLLNSYEKRENLYYSQDKAPLGLTLRFFTPESNFN